MIDRSETPLAARNDRFARAGSIALGMGLLLILARGFETAFGIPGLPRPWYQNDWLWVLVGFVGVGTGCRLLFQSETAVLPGWRPTIPGLRFQKVILYTRSGCHLCEEAHELLNRYRRWLPPLQLIDIDASPELVAKFGTCVPVVEIDQKVRFRGKVHETLLRRLIEGASPVV